MKVKQRPTHIRLVIRDDGAEIRILTQSRRGTRFNVGKILAGHPKKDAQGIQSALEGFGIPGPPAD